MKVISFLVALLVTVVLIIVFDTNHVLPAPLGRLLSPQHGIWQNAEPVDAGFDADYQFAALKGKGTVYLDERLVPHVFAEQEEDAYFMQGFLHAKFRLWQMDFQTMAAAGRISEIIGDKAVSFDREQRRMGMVYGAENALRAMESDPESKKIYDAYTAGVNAYINTLTASALPVEYKLLGYEPGAWSNLKTALLVKQMTKILAGYDQDFAMTNAKTLFTPDQLKLLYPEIAEADEPIIPRGTFFDPPGVVAVAPASADSLYFQYKGTVTATPVSQPDPANGSNNWAVNAAKTKSGAPILCNDPHLDLSFPSIWYEMQISTPHSNVYGVSLPGAPAVVIGFNDYIAWGVTNAERDVKDYYTIRFNDDSKTAYWYNNTWQPTTLKVEEIKVKGKPSVLDTVAYTVFGPVMFDKTFAGNGTGGKSIALRWIGHEGADDGKAFFKLNHAKNYDEYLDAISGFTSPGQNFLFASKTDSIAIWQQAKFPARWKGQGLYIMPGEDSSYLWQNYIPSQENPHLINPDRGFITSANQRPVDSTYPYFIPGSYIPERGITITQKLAAMQQITPANMMQLQNDYYNVFAAMARPLLLKYVKENELSPDSKKYLEMVTNWDLQNSPGSTGATVFTNWFDTLMTETFKDELTRTNLTAPWPEQLTLLEALQKDSTFPFLDNIYTPQHETIFDVVTSALQKATPVLHTAENDNRLTWAKFKNTTIYHLLGSGLMPFGRTGLPVGGGGNIINANTHNHGPSWRMIVQLTSNTEAYAVYPGGQSGNPGSRYYDSFLDTWVAGKYYPLWVMTKKDGTDKRVKWVMHFN